MTGPRFLRDLTDSILASVAVTAIRENRNKRKAYLLQLTVSQVVWPVGSLVSRPLAHVMVERQGRTELLTSWWTGSREEIWEREGDSICHPPKT